MSSLKGFIDDMKKAPIALKTDTANNQHYEVPTDFFKLILGPRLKYSCCFFPGETNNLKQAEDEMLRLTCQRAKIENGQTILELGCGWGSLTLWMAEHFPDSKIESVTNSLSQKKYIDEKARKSGLANVTVIRSDMNDFATKNTFDRVVSVEMFEHMRNYETLFKKVSEWLTPEGLLFIHIFCHREFAYSFTENSAYDWMGKHFFSGGMMPSIHLPLFFQEHLLLEHLDLVNGVHYQKTLRHWLKQLEASHDKVLKLFLGNGLEEKAARRQINRWRVFLLSCQELFSFNNGNEWMVGHFVFRNRRPALT